MPPAQRQAYLKICDEQLFKNYGEPYDVASTIFSKFETADFKPEKLRDDMTGKRIFFAKKLDVMNEEFDTYVGAMVADLIYRQHVLRS